MVCEVHAAFSSVCFSFLDVWAAYEMVPCCRAGFGAAISVGIMSVHFRPGSISPSPGGGLRPMHLWQFAQPGEVWGSVCPGVVACAHSMRVAQSPDWQTHIFLPFPPDVFGSLDDHDNYVAMSDRLELWVPCSSSTSCSAQSASVSQAFRQLMGWS